MRGGKESLFISVGAVVRAHGTRGKIKVKIFSGDTGGLSSAGAVAFQEKDLGSRFPYAQRVKGYLLFPVKVLQNLKDSALLSLEGVSEVTQAQELVGRKVYLLKEALPITGTDEFYYFELEGYRIEDGRGNVLGKVSRLIPSPAHDILEIETPAGERLVPFVDRFVPEVRRKDRVIVLTPIKGMLDDEV